MSSVVSVMAQHDGHVGVIHLRTSKSRVPIRVFYPSKNHGESVNAVGWFANGLSFFVDGYLHFLFGIPINGRILTFPLISWLISFFAWFAPIILLSDKLPKCSAGAEPSTESTSPLIIYSHGLTGSGDEHGLLFAYWAQRGYVVACIHHCDGSSSKVPLSNGKNLLYKRPDLKNYDKNFRHNQIIQREEELHEMYHFVLDDPSFPTAIRKIIDPKRVFVAGFSYGAATASLSAIMRPGCFVGAILLDGWFHVEVQEGFDFPHQVHEKGLDIPALFLGSEQFAQRPALRDATERLVRKSQARSTATTSEVLTGTRHQNFTDVGYWTQAWLLRRVGAIGSCDYHTTYADILTKTHAFLVKHS